MKTVMMLQSKQKGKTIDKGGPKKKAWGPSQIFLMGPHTNVCDGAPEALSLGLFVKFQ